MAGCASSASQRLHQSVSRSIIGLLPDWPAPPTPPETTMHWDTGNIAFMLVSTSLVMLMTPGLAFFYGGLVGRKNVLTIMLQSFVSMGVTTVLWVVCGYSMA